MNNFNWKAALCAGGSVVLCAVAYKMLKSEIPNSKRTFNNVLFYGGDDEAIEQNVENNGDTILKFLSNAEHSIDICVSNVSDALKNSLLEIRLKNDVIVKLVVHSQKDNENLFFLNKQGVQVKISKSTPCIEHEFIIIDGYSDGLNSLALTGAIDIDAKNRRNSIMITSDTCVVENLKKEFHRIWNSTADSTRYEENYFQQ